MIIRKIPVTTSPTIVFNINPATAIIVNPAKNRIVCRLSKNVSQTLFKKDIKICNCTLSPPLS
jgi:hypothetical protein